MPGHLQKLGFQPTVLAPSTWIQVKHVQIARWPHGTQHLRHFITAYNNRLFQDDSVVTNLTHLVELRCINVAVLSFVPPQCRPVSVPSHGSGMAIDPLFS